MEDYRSLNWCHCVPSVEDLLDNPITTFLPVLLTSSVIFSASLLWSSLNSRIKLTAVPSTSTVFYAPLTSHLFLLTCTLWPVFLCLPFYAPSTGPFVFCHGVHKRRRSHVSDTAGRQVQRTSRCVSTQTHTHTQRKSEPRESRCFTL